MKKLSAVFLPAIFFAVLLNACAMQNKTTPEIQKEPALSETVIDKSALYR